MGVGGEGQPTQEHQRTPSTRKTPLGLSAIDAAIKNIQNDLHGNNGRAGDDMTATAMIGGGKYIPRRTLTLPLPLPHGPPTPSATEQNQMPHICHSSSETLTTKRDRAARGTTSAEGKSQGNDKRGGGGGGGWAACAAMPALPVEARGRHQHRLCHFPTAANIHDHGATRGTTSAGGGGGGPPAPQHRHTPSTRGPSTLPHQQQRRLNDRCAREQRARGGGEGPPRRHKVRDRQGGGTAVRVVGRRGDGAAPRRTRHQMRRCRGGGGQTCTRSPQRSGQDVRPPTEAEVRLSPVLPEEEVGGVQGAVVAVSVVVPRSRGGGGGHTVVFAPEEPRRLPSSLSR